MNKRRVVTEKIFLIGTLVLLAVYLGIFAYLNMAKYTEHVDSDIAAEAMLAREIWNTGSLTPDNWISSTERRIIGVPTVAALFYGISGSMVFSMGLAAVLTGGVLLVSIGIVFRQCRMTPLAAVAALLALCALPVNGLRNEGQIVPFVMLLWFLFADYYALHCICLFLSVAFYLHLRGNDIQNKKIKWPDILAWIFLLLLCAGLGLGGMRCLQVITLPMAIWEVLSLFAESGHMMNRLSGKRWLRSGFVFSMLAVSAAAKLHPSGRDYTLYLQDGREIARRLAIDIPGAVLECLGISGNTGLTSLSAVMQLGVMAVLVLTVFGLVHILRRKDAVGREQLLLIQILGTSFLLTVFIEAVTTAETAHNYFFMVWFLIVAVIGVLVTNYGKKAPAFAYLIAGCVCLFAVLNLKYTYAEAVTTQNNLNEYQQVIDYMEEEGIDCGYAEFWDANRICAMSDGKITMGHSLQIEKLQMYWWLTSTEWYVPNLPEEMRTAYVVRQEDKEAFAVQFGETVLLELGFENEKFAVYISDKNLVRMQ